MRASDATRPCLIIYCCYFNQRNDRGCSRVSRRERGWAPRKIEGKIPLSSLLGPIIHNSVTPEALRVAMTPGCGHMDGMQQQQQQPHHFLPLRPPLCLLCHPFFSRRAPFDAHKKNRAHLCVGSLLLLFLVAFFCWGPLFL